MTLTEFLLARIAEDEVAARAPLTENRWQSINPHRVLAECEAKRRIVERCAEAWEQRRPNGTPTEWGRHVWGGLEDACRTLAVVYADHPDYDGEWRP